MTLARSHLTAAMLVLLITCPFVFEVAAEETETLTNETVLQMHAMGFSDGVIVEKIKASQTEFDTRLEVLGQLKDAGLSQEVLMAMMQAENTLPALDPDDPNAQHKPGIYLWREAHDPKLTVIEPSISKKTKTGGIWKNAYSFGVAKVKQRAVFPDLQSKMRIEDRRPVFYFYFGEETAGAFGGITPNEFALVEMKVRDGKGWREVVVGTYNITGGEAGALDKWVVPFDIEEVSPTIFKITPSRSMSDGEYCFYYGGTAPGAAAFGSSGGGTVKVFDFSVRG